jgi:hypothetical protein
MVKGHWGFCSGIKNKIRWILGFVALLSKEVEEGRRKKK